MTAYQSRKLAEYRNKALERYSKDEITLEEYRQVETAIMEASSTKDLTKQELKIIGV